MGGERGNDLIGQGRMEGRCRGCSLVEDLEVLVQEDSGEVVDGSDGAQGHGGVSTPEQVGAEHHR